MHEADGIEADLHVTAELADFQLRPAWDSHSSTFDVAVRARKVRPDGPPSVARGSPGWLEWSGLAGPGPVAIRPTARPPLVPETEYPAYLVVYQVDTSSQLT